MNSSNKHLWIVRATCVSVTLLLVAACSPAAPEIDATWAAARISSWLPGADVAFIASTPENGSLRVEANVSGEPLAFAFSQSESGWTLGGLISADAVLDQAATRAAWLNIVRTSREIELSQLVAGNRPAAPLEVTITGLRVVEVDAERMVLESIAEPQAGRVIVNGRHFDNLPIRVGQEVAIQLQGLAAEDDHWIPARNEIKNELMVDLDPIDVTLLALLKLRLPDQVVPIPYSIPDMEHAHPTEGQ